VWLLQHAPHGPTMAATPHPAMAATAHPRHGRHSTGTPAMGRTDHSTSARHRPPPMPPWPPQHTAALMLALLPHGRHSAPPPWVPQHASTMGATAHPLRNGRMAMAGNCPNMPLGAMAHRGAVASPLGSLVGATCIGGVFCLFSPLCWVQLRAWFLLGTLTISVLRGVVRDHARPFSEPGPELVDCNNFMSCR
jgi:hypothetical protein